MSPWNTKEKASAYYRKRYVEKCLAQGKPYPGSYATFSEEEKHKRKEAKQRRTQKYNQAIVDRHRDRLVELRSHPCTDCQQIWPNACMEFDHVPERGQKIFNISQGIWKSEEKFQAELAKCDLVCANCHRIRTEARRESIQRVDERL